MAQSCLHSSLRIVNLVVNVLGIVMIIYSLWLLKKWSLGVADLPSRLCFPHPWFIYTCLAVGMVVCLSALSGHMIVNCTSNSTLCLYIVTACSLLLVQIGVIVATFFKMDWASRMSKHIDEHHKTFQSFFVFQLKMCQWGLLMIVLAQVNVVVLAIILWATGAELGSDPNHSDPYTLRQSFLVVPELPLPIDLSQSNRIFEVSHCRRGSRGFLSYINRVVRMQILRRTT